MGPTTYRSKHKPDQPGRGILRICLITNLILAILAPLAAKLIQLAISRSREYLADASAALITRNPIGLANALRKIGGSKIISKNTNDAVAPLFISEPFKGINIQNLFSTHPPIEKRIMKLEEMAYLK